MTPHAANCWVLAACCAVSLWVFTHVPGRAPPPPLVDPRVAVPVGTPLLISVDLRRMRSTELGRALLEQSGAQAKQGLSSGCEAVLGRAERLAVLLPRLEDASDLGAIGVAASGRFESTELSRCVSETLAAKGLQVAREQRNGFELFSASGDQPGAGVGVGVVALRADGLLLGVGRPQLDGMLAAASRTAPNIKASEAHRLLRELVGVNGTLVASWFAQGSLSLFPGVRAAALRADFSPGLRVAGVVRCAGELECAELATSLRELSQHPLLALAGVKLPADALQILEQPELLRFTLELASDEALGLFRHLNSIPFAEPG